MKYKAPTGTNDILPDQIPLWRQVEETAREMCGRYGFREIRTPIFEYTPLFIRSIGETTDIVEKEMYTFSSKKESKESSIALRPELTAPVVRAYLEHHLDREQKFQKLYYIGPLFRHERPQRGRTRQFHQLGVEALGSDSPLVDVEIMELAVSFFKGLGISDCVLKINSIGCPKCRSDYREVLKKYFAGHQKTLCDNCRNRYDRNVFRILDCKNQQCYQIAAKASAINDYLCPDCQSHFNRVLEGLKKNGIAYKSDQHLVRGFDYYTKTIFEITHSALGSQDALCGGGRYDNLIKELGGPDLGAAGWAVGLERTIMVLGSLKIKPPGQLTEPPAIFVVSVTPEMVEESFVLLSELRKKGIRASMDYENRSLKAQMRQANRCQAAGVVILGPDELKKQVVKLKQMDSGEESEIKRQDLFDLLSKKHMV